MIQNVFNRILSAVLAFVLLIQLLPVQSFATATDSASTATDTADDQSDIYVIGELEEYRTEDTKHFRLSDGTFIAVDYGLPVHFQDENGLWQDIDNSLSSSTAASTYQIRNADTATAFSTSLDDGTLFTTSRGDVRISVTLLDTSQMIRMTSGEVDADIPAEEAETEIEAPVEESAEEADAEETSIEETTPEEPSLTHSESTEENADETAESAEETQLPAETDFGTAFEETAPAETTVATKTTEAPESTETEKATLPEETTSEAVSPETIPEIEAELPAEADDGEEVTNDTSAAGIAYNREATVSTPEDMPTMLNLEDDYTWDVEDIIPDNLQSSVLYEEVFPDVDILYTTYGYNIKEQIIVKEPTSFYRYDFLMELDGLTAALNEDGSVSLLDADGVEVYMIPVPYMTDSAANLSMDVTFSLTEAEQGTILTVQADEEWINAEERVFPVMIDPTISITSGSALDDIYSVYTMEDAPNTTTLGRQQLYCGACPNSGYANGRYRIYMYFNRIPNVPEYSEVIGASLCLYKFIYGQRNCDQFPIGLFQVTDDYSSNYSGYYNWFVAMTWNNQPEYDTANMIDYALAKSGSGYLSWDMTELVKAWYASGTNNRSIALAMVNEEDLDQASYYAYTAFYAYAGSVPPALIVSYRNNTGIEPYYTYQTLDAGAAGTAYIADATGQLKVVKELVSYASTTNPVSVNLVYNSDYFASSSTNTYTLPEALGLDMTVGYGWTLDVIQKVEDTTIDGVDYKKYTDGDGSIHYFRKDTEKDSTGTYYYDEDGLGLKIKDNGTNAYIMSDESGNTWNFTGNFLRSIVDADHNTIHINYANGRLTTISQENNKGTEIRVATFAYEGNELSTVTDAAGVVYKLTYSTSRLFEIKQDNATVARYVYMGNRVRKLTDVESGYSIDSTYGSDGRIASFNEIVGSTTGAAVTVTYPGNVKTVYRNHGANRTAEDSDDILTHYMFDNAGRTVNAYTTDHYSQILGASNAVYYQNSAADKRNNRTMRTSSIGVAAQQLVRNTGFESGDSSLAWTLNGFALSQQNPRTGAKSLRSILTADNTVSAKRISEALAANNKYCFSVYVNTSQITDFTGDGIYLKVTDTSGNSWTSDPLSYATSDKMDGGWVRLSMTFTTKTADKHTLSIYNDGAIGTLYVDDAQLEKGEAPSSYNMVENGSMEMGAYAWTKGNADACYVSTGAGVGASSSMRIAGDPTDDTTMVYQDIPVGLPLGNTFVISGWGKANAIPDNQNMDDDADTNKQYGLRAVIYYADGETEAHYVPFCASLGYWQFTSATIVPKRENYNGTIEKIRVVCSYEKNANLAYFDNISLVREIVQTMKYDKEGNLISVTTSGMAADENGYDSKNRLSQIATAGNGTYSYTYGNDSHPYSPTIVTLKDSDGGTLLKETMTYDAAGNVTKSVLSGTGAWSLETSASYADKNRLASVTDANGYTVRYNYADDKNIMTGLPSSVINPEGTYTHTEYDSNYRVSKTWLANIASLAYNYSSGNLSSVVRTDSAGNSTQSYKFEYDAFGNMTAAKVGTVNLASYVYAPNNGLLLTQTYANGDTVTYTYDKLDRVKTATYSDGRKLTYTYTGDGQLYSVTETENGVTTTDVFEYDALGRVLTQQRRSGGETVLVQDWNYDEYNQLTRSNWKIGSATFSELFTYNTDGDGSLATVKIVGENTRSFSYDRLRRLSAITGSINAKQYYYRNDITDDTITTNEVSSVSYTGLGSSHAYQYTYNDVGNIETYSAPGKATVTYTYDKQGQLLSANSNTNSYSYTYDNVGNILTATKNGTTHTYTYSTYDWKDKLISYDGQPIAYDASGNPTSYYNGTRWIFGWENGRELTTATSGNTSLTFTYDCEGIRTSKTVNGVKHSYYYNNAGQLIRESYSGTVLDFFYNPDGTLYALRYNGTYYYYITNLQGDVVGIVDASGNTVASYEYDPYGGIISATGTLAATNPMRYRGYYYDTETGLYYVSSRYYDPEIGRWINADDTAYLGADGTPLSYNLFAYCKNNPVMGYDPSGTFDWGSLAQGGGWLATGIAALVVGVSVLTCGVATPLMVGVALATAGAGALTVANGASEIGEAFTGYNVMRDGVFQGNATAYNAYAYSTAAVAQVGTAICGGWMANNSPRINAYKSMDSYNVKGKHLPSATGKWSKFSTSSQAELRELGKEVLKNTPMSALTPNSSDSFRTIYNFGRVIGTSGETSARLVFSAGGQIITFFPQ